MEYLIRQSRARFFAAGKEKEEETSNIRDRRIPLQKTQSFKGEKKKTQTQNWFRRLFSRQMNQDNDTSEDYQVAVAAAAFAITSLEELSIREKKKTSEGPDTSLINIKSKTEDTTSRMSEAGKISRRFSGETSITNVEVPDQRVQISAATNDKMPEKAVGPVPSIKKTLTFDLNNTASKKPQRVSSKPDLPTPKQPAFVPADTRRQTSTRLGIEEETKADIWEKAEMAKIKERYEKMNTTILDWEKKKKEKAKRKMDRTESELARRRAKALQEYQIDMERINQIAGGARSQAEENQRNEEFKVKDKANKIRSTGRIPATCLCF